MSCTTCGSTSSCGCNPCNQVQNDESLASQISNLVNTLFGDLTKTIDNGRAVWSQVCYPYTDGVPCYPRADDEGFICYFLRLLDAIGTFSASIHDSALAYCKNSMVASSNSLYIAILAVPAGTLISNTTYWRLLITAPAGTPGAAGPQGTPGASGAGSATNYATQTSTVDATLGNSGAVVFCKPGAAPITITLPLISSVDAGKWYKIKTNGAFNVTIARSGGNTINGVAGNITLAIANEAVELVADTVANDWNVF